MSEFRYVSYAQEVIFASGALSRLGEALERFGWQRLILCTSHSLQANGTEDRIKSVVGDRLVATFNRVQPHVPDIQVDEVLELANEHDIDAVIGLGGGSPIGMAKAVASALEEKRTGHPAPVAAPTDQPLIPVVAIPTTYAGSEMTAVYGITHTRQHPSRKVTVSDPKIAPGINSRFAS
jgi:alcohol dehydrogenase class IV